MTDRVLSVRLQFLVNDAKKSARDASNAVAGIGTAAERAGRTSTAGLSRVGQAAVSAGKAAAAVGGLAAGGLAVMTTSVVKGGVAYNNLEQTSRAALKTVLGSATAATNQMEQLREFGKTSPFPRQVWISAQQQLLAFGMEAEKIIPTFSAIQDAVAAAGGSGETISEITQIIAKIQSTGKVTAEELNELGFRGIDAATLIGDAMGKTAGEVREDITSQAITGVQFIDQLTAAMSQRFGGAAENVKQTWAGTTDRIKGAIRDIGSVLATPLVDPEGGGAAVQWGNDIADALRAFEARLIPAVDALEGRMEPAIEAVSEKIQDLAHWIETADFSQMGQRLQSMLPAIAGVSAGFLTMGARSLPVIGDMVSGLKPLPVAIAAAALASPELRQALIDLLMAAQPLISTAGQIVATLAGSLGPALSVVAGLLQPVIGAVQVLANMFGALPGPMQALIVGFVAFKALNLSSMFSGITTAAQNFGQQMKAQQSLASMSGQQVGQMGAAYSAASVNVQRATTGIRTGLSNVVGFLGGPWGAAITAGTLALTLFGQGSDSAAMDHRGLADALEAGTGAITNNTREWVLNKLETDGMAETYRKAGGDVQDLIDAFLGVPGAATKVNDVLADGRRESRITGQELQALWRVLRDAPGVMSKAKGAAKDKADADRDGAGAANASASAQSGLAGALNATTGAASTAAQQMQMLNGALSETYDLNFAGEEAADGFQAGLHKLRNAFASNTKAVGGSQKANDSAKRAADAHAESLKRQGEIARDTAKQLEDLAESQRQAEQEAREAAKAARQRQLDELFGRQFDRVSTKDAFRSALAQARADLTEAKAAAKKDPKTAVRGLTALSGFSEGALENRERLRNLTQAAQAAIQAEKDAGASKARIAQVTRQMQAQLATEAQRWGLNAREVQTYTRAIGEFGRLANAKVVPNLAAVRREFAEQRAEIHQNSREQIENSREQAENARETAAQAAVRGVAASATKVHTAALEGNSESAIENRGHMRHLVEQAQKELIQDQLNGATKEELTAKGEKLARQLEREARQVGMTKDDVARYTRVVRDSAAQVARFPTLKARADTADAARKMVRFFKDLKKRFDSIPRDIPISIRADRQDRLAQAASRRGGGYATGGYVSGPGGPTEDKIPAWLSNGEYVINARQTARHKPLLEQINSGAAGYAAGGYVSNFRVTANERSFDRAADRIESAVRGFSRNLVASTGPLAWAQSQHGKPYIWGGVGPAGYDCSGFMSAITNVIQGRNPHARRFATGSFPTGDFARGPGRFSIGSFRGNPGHMAGTLLGYNVESRGGDGVVVGPAARGARDGLFGGNVWHLKGFAQGGAVEAKGDPPFDLISPLGKHFDRLLGSYASGTDYVPMDGAYWLHRGEAVTPAAQNREQRVVVELRGDNSRWVDAVVDAFNQADGKGRIFVRSNR